MKSPSAGLFHTVRKIGCASNSGNDQTITFQWYDKDGYVIGSPFSFTLKAWSWAQYA